MPVSDYESLFDRIRQHPSLTTAAVPSPSEPDIKNLIKAVLSQLLSLVHESSREAVTGFVRIARRALILLRDEIGEDNIESRSFHLGQLDAIVTFGQMLGYEKLPEDVVRLVARSAVAEDALAALLENGPMRLADLGRAISRQPSNLVSLIRQLELANLIRKEQYSKRDARLFATPLAKAVLTHFKRASADEELEVRAEHLRAPALNAIRAPETKETAAAPASLPGDIAVPAEDSRKPASKMKMYIFEHSEQVRSIPDHTEQLRATNLAACGFVNLFGVPPEPRQRERLKLALKSSTSYIVEDGDLKFLGGEPAIYWPDVIDRSVSGVFVIDVLRFVEAIDTGLREAEKTKTVKLPGQISAELVYAAAETAYDRNEPFARALVVR